MPNEPFGRNRTRHTVYYNINSAVQFWPRANGDRAESVRGNETEPRESCVVYTAVFLVAVAVVVGDNALPA